MTKYHAIEFRLSFVYLTFLQMDHKLTTTNVILEAVIKII